MEAVKLKLSHEPVGRRQTNKGAKSPLSIKQFQSAQTSFFSLGVANKDYDAAPIASSVLERMIQKGVVNRDDLRVIWESKLFPTTSYGYVNTLNPELAKKVADAFLSFDWEGSGLEKEFGKQADRFIPITYMNHWSDIRTIQKTNGVVYSQESLEGLKVKKAKKKKKS